MPTHASIKDFMLFATPWWVNLLVLVPVISFYFWYRRRLVITLRQLLYAALFATAFGFVEAAVVDYLRGNIPKLAANSGTAPFESTNRAEMPVIPPRLLHTEQLRETATLIMLLCVPLLATARARERWALFLWCFAIWDLVYYLGLHVLIRWPNSLLTMDVLFLIPVPWFSQIWFPVAVSGLSILAVLAGRLGGGRTGEGFLRPGTWS
jgi:hypothetical protein